MDMNEKNLHIESEELQNLEVQISECIKENVSEEFYDIWVEDFALEEINEKQAVVGYYGTQSLKTFNKEHKETVRSCICHVVGADRKLIVRRRKSEMSVLENPTVKKNIKTIKLLTISMAFAAFACVFAVIACNYVINRNFRETFYSVSSLKVDSPVRVVQISDLHDCSFGKDNAKLIARIKKLNPDIILCTGDIIDSDRQDNKKAMKLCSEISKIAPAYYIYGNNEVETVYDFPLTQKVLDEKFGFDEENRDAKKLLELEDKLMEQLEKSGIKVLKNDKATLNVGTTRIDVFGVLNSNPSSFWTYAGMRFAEYIDTEPENLKITAIHEPFIFEEFEPDFWGDLLICGHTHGGSVRVPYLGPLYTHEGGLFPGRNNCFVHGRYDAAGKPLIVSSGLANNNLLRINNQPELVIIDISKF